MNPLPPDQLDALRRFTTPTISNALERLGLPHSLDNQTDGSIKCIFPDLPVTVGGLKILPGDLIHADRHGALVIPKDLAPKVAAAARAVENYEQPMIQLAKSPDFTTEKLAELLKKEIV